MVYRSHNPPLQHDWRIYCPQQTRLRPLAPAVLKKCPSREAPKKAPAKKTKLNSNVTLKESLTKFKTMARTNYLDFPVGQEELYFKGLQSGDRFIFPRIVRKNAFMSRQKVAGLTAKSYLPIISDLWADFTDEVKDAWKAVDTTAHPHGWRTFVADQSKRIKQGYSGTATPNEFHQDLVGAINIESPAEEVLIAQYHPAFYYIQKKIQGTKNTYEPVMITEEVSLPLVLSINYKSDLTSTGAGSFCRFFGTVRHFYQGRDIDTDLTIDIPLSGGWATLTETLSSLLGEIVGYNLFIHIYKCTGTLWFDNVKATHSGQNWCRDTYCKDISQIFTRAYYQVPKNWAPITLPTGTDYDSIYPI